MNYVLQHVPEFEIVISARIVNTIAIAIFWISLCTVLFQAALAVQFAYVLLRRRKLPGTDAPWPKTAVLLSLRGAEPELADGLWRLLEQDYPNFRLHVVVDSLADPAWDIVHQIHQKVGEDRLQLSVLTERLTTCGLQCSALSQAARQIEADAEVVVTIDGDLLAHRSWLRELVAPLLDNRVGAAFGNRWFMAQPISWGVIVRYLWNVAAVVPMYLLGIPWGGSFAIRRSALEKSGLLDAWSKAIVHDAPAKSLLNKLGLKIRFVPSLMMVLRDGCDLSFCRDFLKRQMTWTRLYHPRWSPLVVHAVATALIWPIAIGVMIAAALLSQHAAFLYSSLAIAIYVIGMLLLIALIEFSMRCVIRRRGESTTWLNWQAILMLALGIPLTQLIYSWVVLEATFRRHVKWRGVTYVLRGPWDIERLEEQTVPLPEDVAR